MKLKLSISLVFFVLLNLSGQNELSYTQQSLLNSIQEANQRLGTLRAEVTDLPNARCLEYLETIDDFMQDMDELSGKKYAESAEPVLQDMNEAYNEEEQEEASERKKSYKWNFDVFDDDDVFFKRKQKRTSTYFNYSLGLNSLLVANDAVSPDIEPWSSRTFEIGLTSKTKLGSSPKSVRFTYGFLFMRSNFQMNDRRLVLNPNAEGGIEFVNIDGSIRRSSFRVSYLTVPVGFEFRFGRKGYFGFNGYGGLRTSSSTKLEFNTDLNEEIRQRGRSGYEMNNFVYGARAYVGFDDVSIFARYDASPLFKNNDNYNILAFGVKFDL
jgi:hypothetical protein